MWWVSNCLNKPAGLKRKHRFVKFCLYLHVVDKLGDICAEDWAFSFQVLMPMGLVCVSIFCCLLLMPRAEILNKATTSDLLPVVSSFLVLLYMAVLLICLQFVAQWYELIFLLKYWMRTSQLCQTLALIIIFLWIPLDFPPIIMSSMAVRVTLLTFPFSHPSALSIVLLSCQGTPRQGWIEAATVGSLSGSKFQFSTSSIWWYL